MISQPSLRLRCHSAALSSLAAIFLLLDTLVAAGPAAPAPVAVDAHPLTLAECIHIALDKQPALAAYRASLAGAQASLCYVNSVRVPTILKPDLPVRRCQAALGLGIAQAALDKAESETIYAVTRTYRGALYAREQQAAAQQSIEMLKARREQARQLLLEGQREDVTPRTITSIGVSILVTESIQQEAAEGVQRALAALREAMGVGMDFCMDVADGPLTTRSVAELCREQVVELALARRGELVMTSKAAEVVALEINAQCVLRGFKTFTFAAGADLHADPLPAASSNSEYHPGPVGLEMPATLNGSRCFRVERMRLYSARADAVAVKARNLVILDAEDGYLRWKETARRSDALNDAARLADDLVAQAWKDALRPVEAGKQRNIKSDDALTGTVVAMQFRLQAIEAQYKHDLARTNLEKVTAGGFCAGLVK